MSEGQDWAEDDSMSREETLRIFYSLPSAESEPLLPGDARIVTNHVHMMGQTSVAAVQFHSVLGVVEMTSSPLAPAL